MATPTRTPRPTPLPAPPAGRAVHDLLALARAGLAEAALATTPAERYAAAHLAALRVAAAVLAARARPRTARQPRSAWALLAEISPELAEWATFFAAGAGKRAAAEAGLSSAVSARDADDLLRQAEAFLELATTMLGLPHEPTLSDAVSALRAG